MANKKKKRLEEKGWKVGTAKDFLGLTPDEAAYIELKLRFSENLRKRRQQKKLGQVVTLCLKNFVCLLSRLRDFSLSENLR